MNFQNHLLKFTSFRVFFLFNTYLFYLILDNDQTRVANYYLSKFDENQKRINANEFLLKIEKWDNKSNLVEKKKLKSFQ